MTGTPHPRAEAAAGLAGALRSAGADLDRAAVTVRTSSVPTWRGAAAEAAADARRADARRIDTVAATLDLAARACEEHAVTLRALAAAPRDQATDDRALVLAAEDACVAALAAATAGLRPTAAAPDDPGTGPDPPAALAALVAGALLQVRRGRPADVRRWWEALTPHQQDHLVRTAPALVGSADGVPARDRDRANRARLAADAAVGVPGAGAAAAALALAAGRVDPATGAALPVLLVAYAPRAFDGDGAAAVAYGDPDAADHVAVLVPGFGSDLAGLARLGRDALTLQQAASEPGASVAVVGWQGYDAPAGGAWDSPRGLWEGVRDAAGVAGEQAARTGAERLDGLLAGLGVPSGSPADPAPHLSLVGHSYGSTTAAHAFAGAPGGPPADELVLLGSPGAGGGVEHATDLHPGDGVHVAAADADPVTWLGGPGAPGLGPDPAQVWFGAARLPTGPGASLPGPGEDGLVEQARRHHASYLAPGSASLSAVAAVLRGEQPPTVPGRTEPARLLLVRWLTSAGVGPPGSTSLIR